MVVNVAKVAIFFHREPIEEVTLETESRLPSVESGSNEGERCVLNFVILITLIRYDICVGG